MLTYEQQGPAPFTYIGYSMDIVDTDGQVF